MFTDEYIPGISVKSSWKTSRKCRENGSQTSEIITYEVDSQTAALQESGVQTIPLEELLKNSASIKSQNYNEASVVAFLSSVEGMISKQLQKNSSFNVFEDLMWGYDDGSSDTSIACEYCLTEKSVQSEMADDENSCEVTCLSWSSSGASVAVAYGSMKPMPWGQARSFLCTWNIDRTKVNLLKCDQKLEVDSSLQAVAFHPSNPGLIAAGLFSGSVLIWDLSTDEVVYSSESHEDPVTVTCWLESSSRKYVNLMSASTDGKIKIWKQKVSRKTQPLEILKTFKIRASSVRGGHKGIVGVTCCATSVPVSDGVSSTIGEDRTLIAGCENGAIVKCSINEDIPLDDPVVFSYENHVGPVYSVDWSPFHRHIFLSCSTDQRCRFYHSLHSAPLREVTPYTGPDQYLFSACWSPTRAMTLYSAGAHGTLAVYDASNRYIVNSVSSEGKNGKKCQINCLAMNRKRFNYIATGNADGIIYVWQLGSRFTTPDNEAKAALDKLAEGAMSED